MRMQVLLAGAARNWRREVRADRWQDPSILARKGKLQSVIVLMHSLMLSALVLSSFFLSSIAHAQDAFPNKPVTIIVPFDTGGSTDVLARVLGEKLSAKWGQPVVIENRPGASGSIGAGYVARSAADGYTLVLSTSTANGSFELTNPAATPYHTMTDFEPVALVAASPLILVLRSGLDEIKSVSDFVEYAKSQAGALKIATTGPSSIPYLAAKNFSSIAQIEMLDIAYNGQSTAIQAVLSGEVDAYMSGPLISETRPLAVAWSKRIAQLPETPTFAEQGYPDFDFYAWFGILAPDGVPEDVMAKLEKDVVEAAALPDVQQRFSELGFEPIAGGREQLTESIQTYMAKAEKILAAESAKPEASQQ